MTESVLLELMNRFVERSNYCVICLRTDKERRLEKPKHLKRFMQTLDQQFTHDRPYQLVCFVCERQAASAFRFRRAVQVAAHAHTLTHQLLNKATQRNKLSAAVRKMQSSQEVKAHPGWLKDMLDCEMKLRKQKMLTQLLNTEVLIVSTNATSTPRNAETETEHSSPFETVQCPRPGESQDLYVIPDEQPPTETNDLNCKLEISDDEKESIIILDDDEREKRNPMLVIDSGKICNDLQRAEPKQMQTVKTIEQLYIVKPLDPTHESSSMNFLLHPIVIIGNNINIPTLSSTIKNGKVLNEQNEQMNNPQIAYHDGSNICFITDPNEVNVSLQNLCRNEILESGKKRVNEIVRVIDGNEKESRPPQLRSDRIDWEDKIPMDVISFVDDEYGGDASKRARPMPEIGISNVTSLIEPQSDVIDLC